MKKNFLLIAFFAAAFSMTSCGGAEEKKEADKTEEEMSVDEKELEEEFEKLDEDVEKMDTMK